MFERFTGRARQVVVLAQEEARMLDHNYIGTEHLLLGLLHEGSGTAATALQSAGITEDAARRQIEEIIGRGPRPASGHLPFTPRAKKVLELALREALQLGHNYIGTEHILLGLIREGEGVAIQVVARLGADLGQLRQQVIQLAGGDRGQEEPQDGGGAKAGRGRRKLLARIEGRLSSIESRLSALEHRVGSVPDRGSGPDLRELEREVVRLRLDKEAAIDAQEFDQASALRRRELELLDEMASRQRAWAAAHPEQPSLSDEVEEIRGLLRRHGIDPQDGAA